MSKWQQVKKFFNSKEIGSEITRKEFIEQLNLKNRINKFTTVDSYRLCLTNCGFLKNTNQSGIYILVEKIPEDLSLTGASSYYNWTSKLCKKRK